MDINFPLILVILVFASGVVWLYDFAVLSRPRKQAVAAAEQQFSPDVDRENDAAYLQAMATAAREPVVVEYAKSFFPVLLLVLVLRSFLFEPFQIPSESMVPTLEVGDFILVNKFTYGIRLPVIRTKVLSINSPERGDVMVFFPPHKKQYFIKRVIGLPGDKIVLDNNILYINGEEQPQVFTEQVIQNYRRYNVMEEELGGATHQMRKQVLQPGLRIKRQSWVVPEGHYFMMGDNRDNSADSRKWGYVPEENIVGKAVATWMHWEGFSLPSFSNVGPIQ